ncbi:hypothetical protein PHYSODRAFT_392284, partial [Phytophthora sojae]
CSALKYHELYADLTTTAENVLSQRKVAVHGLAPETETIKLKQRFITFGKVEDATIIRDKSSGKSLGFGYVTFAESKAAQQAIRTLKIKVDGNYVKYNLAAEGKKASADLSPDRTLMVRALAKKTSNDTLWKAFEKFGEVESTHVVRNRSTNASKGYGFVTFREKAGADSALKTPTMKIDVRLV